MKFSIEKFSIKFIKVVLSPKLLAVLMYLDLLDIHKNLVIFVLDDPNGIVKVPRVSSSLSEDTLNNLPVCYLGVILDIFQVLFKERLFFKEA